MATRIEYLIDESQWEPRERISVVARVLQGLAPSVTSAETDIPWSRSSTWPPEVRDAANVLIEAYVPWEKRDRAYMRTRFQAVDEKTRAAFVAVAPYAYDCTMSDQDELASLADEGTSLVMCLTEDEAGAVRRVLGSDRLVTLAEWRIRYPRPSLWARLKAFVGGG